MLDEQRACLAPHTIQICVCKKNCDQANRKTQLKNDDSQGYDDPWMTMDKSTSSGVVAETSNRKKRTRKMTNGIKKTTNNYN